MRSIRSFLCVCVVALLVFCCDLSAQTMAKPAVVIQTGSMVAFDYTLTDESGTVIDSSKGKEPMHYVHGKGQIIPGLEKELEGLPVGGEKKVTVKPEDGYGKLNPNAVQEVPKEKVPPNALKVGAVLVGTNKDGSPIPMTVREIKEKTVVMDLNHPLAGKTLVFDVKVIDVEPAPAAPTPNHSAAPAQPSAPPKPVAPPQKK